MLSWLTSTVWTVGWYVLLLGGWYLWLRALHKSHQQEVELTRLTRALYHAQTRKMADSEDAARR